MSGINRCKKRKQRRANTSAHRAAFFLLFSREPKEDPGGFSLWSKPRIQEVGEGSAARVSSG